MTDMKVKHGHHILTPRHQIQSFIYPLHTLATRVPAEHGKFLPVVSFPLVGLQHPFFFLIDWEPS